MTRPTPVLILLASFATFLCWLAPGHYYPWISFQNEIVAAVGGLLFCGAAITGGRGGLAWPRLATFAALVALVPLIQLLSGQIAFVSDGVLALLYVLALAAAISVGAELTRTEPKAFLDGLFGGLLAAGIVSVGLALVQWLGLGPVGYVAWIPPGDRPFANLGQPNHLASLFALALLGGLWLYETHRISGKVFALVAAWLLVGLVMSRSRMVWVVVFVVAGGWLLLHRRMAMRVKPRELLGFVALFVLGVLLWGPMSEAVGTVAPVSVAERVQAGGGRLRIWSALVDALLESPWIGYGWSQVSRAGFAGSLSHYTGEAMLRNSHNTPLDLLIWNGIPLGLLIVGGLVFWLVQQVRQCDSAQRAIVLASVLVVAVHAMFEFPLEYLYFLIPTGLFAGALAGWDASVPLQRLPRALAAAIFAVLLGMTAWVASEYSRIEEASRDNRMLAAGYARSAELPDVVLLDEPREYMRFWRTQARAAMPEAQIEWMRKITERNPAPPSLLRYALALGLNSRPQDATDTLVRLCNMHNAARCDEGRKSWGQLQSQNPVLTAVTYPRTPAQP